MIHTSSAVTWLLPFFACAATLPPQDLYDPGVFRTLELRFLQTDWYAQIVQNKRAEIYIKGDLRVDGRWYTDVGVRGRGGTAWAGTLNLSSRKLPFKISMDEFVPGQSLYGYDALDLNNGYRDPTFLREALALRTMREFLPAPRANLVKLVINGENWGVYINLQPIDGRFVREHYRNATGNRYKGDHDLKYYGPDPNAWKFPIKLKSPNGPGAYVDLLRAMLTTTLPLAQRVVEMPRVIDLDLAHRHLAINVLLGNTDSLPTHNYYLYLDPYHDLMRALPWDMNLAFVGTSNGMYYEPRIFDDADVWVRRYRGHLRDAVERVLDWRVIGAWATAWHAMIDAEVKADTKKLYSYQEFQQNLELASVTIAPNVTISSIRAAVDRRRVGFLAHGKLSGPRVRLADLTAGPGLPAHTQPLQFTVRATASVAIHRVWLHHRARGFFREAQMFDDGLHGDGAANDGVFGVQVPPQPAGSLVEYYVSAEADLATGGDVSFLPVGGAFRPRQLRVRAREDGVLIHEFVARNASGLRDPAGERDDWIELFNPTAAPIDLGGHHLTDNAAEPTKWTFPSPAVLPPGGYLLVWADEQPAQPGLHASFKLSGDGEELALFEPAGTHALDYVGFGPQQQDVATGRLFDRPSPFVSLRSPTPAAANELSPCGARTFGAPDPLLRRLDLSAAGSVRIGTTFAVLLDRAPASSAALLQIAARPAAFEVPALGFWQLVAPPVVAGLVLPTDVQGRALLVLQLPNDPKLVGQRVAMQALSYDATGFLASNGLELGPCR